MKINTEGAPKDPEGRSFRGWINTVTSVEGETVRVMFDGREGRRLFVRQIDPTDVDPPRAPYFEGDEVVAMTVVAAVEHHHSDEATGADLYLFATRVIPVRREPGHVYARTLRRGEADDGTRVHLRPGDTLTFEEGAILAELEAIDDWERAGIEHGWVPLTPVLWTWLGFVPTRDAAHVRYLLAAARRLDEAARLVDQTTSLRDQLASQISTGQVGPLPRRTFFKLVGATEVAVVALERVVDMAEKAPTLLATPHALPAPVTTKREAMRQVRNAYEHIEDRAFGRDRQRVDPSVLTIFDHHELVTNNRIAYRGHTLDLATEVPQLLTELRAYFKTIAGTM